MSVIFSAEMFCLNKDNVFVRFYERRGGPAHEIADRKLNSVFVAPERQGVPFASRDRVIHVAIHFNKNFVYSM
jgi:hypothetical protein